MALEGTVWQETVWQDVWGDVWADAEDAATAPARLVPKLKFLYVRRPETLDMTARLPKDVNGGVLEAGDVDLLVFPVWKDGAPWAGIDSVGLTFEAPDRTTTFTRAADLRDDSAGEWEYQTTAADLTTPGYWTVRVTVTDGSIVKSYPAEISFLVLEQP